MLVEASHTRLHSIGRAISIGVIACTAILVLIVMYENYLNPRTDDAEVFANYIGMAPLVNGPVTHLYIYDNELVKRARPCSILTIAPTLTPWLMPARSNAL